MRWVSLIYIGLIGLLGSEYNYNTSLNEEACMCDPERDKQALIDLYNATSGNDWKNNDN